MIQMQRSSSLPGQSHASPRMLRSMSSLNPLFMNSLADLLVRTARSPVVTQLSSRNPTPAPFNRTAKQQWLLGPESPYTPFLRAAQEAPTTEALNDIAAVPSRSLGKPEELSSASNGKLRHQPLLQDVSQYTSAHMRDVASDSASTTLEELAHLARLSTYQERKRFQSRIRLQRSLVSTALSARLARCGELAYRTLVDNFRADDKKSFATLYNAVHDVRNSCDATRRYALLEPELDLGPSKVDAIDEPGAFTTFMHGMPAQSRDTLLHFLSQIRTNPEYLASRLSSLTAPEMSALTIFHQGLEPIDSVLPFHTRSKGHAPSSNRNSAQIPSAVERLLSFQRHDPLSALIHTCFANSAGSDSAEDIRRTEVWATACARLLTENKSGLEPFLISVLNIWTPMRDWSGRGNMEWYLMKILEDGAFLLEKAEDQAGTRIHVEPRNAKDSIAADEFYESAIKGLFEIVDDSSAGGIPQGLLELGNAILRKIDSKKHASMRRFLVSRWLFGSFITNTIIHPESYGMMSEYHITEYGRQKILKEVAMRASKLVVDLVWKQSGATPPEIRTHIERIMSQFHGERTTISQPKLLPARSMTSLRETVEVHPYLVISPSDLITLVNALYPERRPTSGPLEKDSYLNGLRSATSSISGVSMPSVKPPSRSAFDTASIISNSGSSVFSDATSREPTFDDVSINTHRFSSTSISSMSQAPRSEDEGYRLRVAIRDMSQALGAEITSGSCHPCAEQWAVLFMDSDGQNLSTQMIHDNDEDADADGDVDEDEDSSSSDSGMEEPAPRPDLDKGYHQLRDSILKLVEDYEIPQTANTKNVSQTFSNRPTASLGSPKKRRVSRNELVGDEVEGDSRNPYRTRDAPPDQVDTPAISADELRTTEFQVSRPKSAEHADSHRPVLLEMLEAAENQCKAQSDFITAHLYWRTIQQLHQLSSPSLKRDGYVSLLNIFSRGPRDSIRQSATAIEEYDAWLVWLKQSQERHDATIESMMKRLKSLRDKMWYVTDVRNSAAYEGARNVAVALKTMGASKISRYLPTTSTRPRNISRSSTNNFLLKTEAQVLDILAASEDQGGPNKLSDDQSDKTKKWLSQYGIYNFCKGEERIHRFCLEIDTCINKLVGDSLMEGPVLWSSELYYRDKRVLDTGRQKGDLVMTGLGTLSISGDFGQDSEPGRRGLRSLDMNSPARHVARDLRSMSARNGSQQSVDSSRWSIRSNTVGDIMDSQDYFGMASPVLTIDSANTFWSPFHTRIQSPSSSLGNFRPGTSSTTGETVISTDSEIASMVAKKNFLTNLKCTLTSLLISDLGTLVFARGSETDSWFSGDLGYECVERKERQERRSRRKKKSRVIEKKKSFRDLRSAHLSDPSTLDGLDVSDDRGDKGSTVAQKPATGHSTPDSQSVADTSSNSDSRSGASLHKWQQSLEQSGDFPYKAAFYKLLRMFSVHPNPYAKLNALYELEHLIIASLTSNPNRKYVHRDAMPTTPQSPVFLTDFASREAAVGSPWAQTLDDANDHRTGQRSYGPQQADISSASRKASDNRSVTVASTDMIVDVLQDLFREAEMLPKTLFRDLQFIAAFVPASVLDKTDKGKAFWDAGLAALGMKQDICRTLVEIADEIVLYYTQTRQTSTLSLPEGRAALKGEVMKFGMQDAAKMWTITAKEGDAVAERELAIFYLTHPELVDRTTLPLTKPSETFKAQVMEMHGGAGGGKEGDRERSDPATMCVAYHWMELSALGGDELAKKYLRQREELNALP